MLGRLFYEENSNYLPSDFKREDNAECIFVSKEDFPKLYSELNELSQNKYVKSFGTIKNLKDNLCYELQNMTVETALRRIMDSGAKREWLASYGGNDDLAEEYRKYFQYEAIIIYNKFQDKLWEKFSNSERVHCLMNINDAIMYLYDANTIEEAKEKEKKYLYKVNQQKGEPGEKEVEYALKWLDKSYIVMSGKNSHGDQKEKIILYNEQFIDEKQEFDHIIIGQQGVFLIETKNYTGTIEIDQNGNWIRMKKDGIRVGEKNPIQQIRRHEKLMKSIVNVPVMSIICLANSQVIIEGIENSKVPIIKSDLLVEYIESYRNEENISKEKIDQCRQSIEKYMI